MSSTTHPKTGFVLSGGAALGAAQVGMLLALAEEGIEPDLIIGTSVGAVNGAWIAAHPGSSGVEELADIWQRIRREDVFPTRPLTGGVVNNTPISHAVGLGATTVWVLSTGYACALEEPPRRALAMAHDHATLAVDEAGAPTRT